jgi:hypothetical protein
MDWAFAGDPKRDKERLGTLRKEVASNCKELSWAGTIKVKNSN